MSVATDTQNAKIVGEITQVDDIARYSKNAEGVLEEFVTVITVVGNEAKTLQERYIEAPYGTAALTLAVTHITEALAGGANGSGDAITEALIEIKAAIPEARTLGDKAKEIGAEGGVKKFETK